jgi:hypothetical protein
MAETAIRAGDAEEIPGLIPRTELSARSQLNSEEVPMNLATNPRFLAIYSGVLTLVFAGTVLSGFAILGLRSEGKP